MAKSFVFQLAPHWGTRRIAPSSIHRSLCWSSDMISSRKALTLGIAQISDEWWNDEDNIIWRSLDDHDDQDMKIWHSRIFFFNPLVIGNLT